jgi:hypothetical protein
MQRIGESPRRRRVTGHFQHLGPEGMHGRSSGRIEGEVAEEERLCCGGMIAGGEER